MSKVVRRIAKILSALWIASSVSCAKPSSTALASRGQDALNHAPDLSKTTGALEETWFLLYYPFEYYGFDEAGQLWTRDTIAKVQACPFSTADKEEFVDYVRQMQRIAKILLSDIPMENGKRPNDPDVAQYGDIKRAAADFKDPDKRKLFQTLPCYTGGPYAI